ncbi:TetR/AcrR family transcriptional regulator [Anaerotignum propionicum]|uniref:HTH-type transcriptional repressor KstR2 n=1 Tax=Anaerotignum propionicum DSM 1682 TaxID=991789 RepID=A0A0X1U6N0_ANAPI|nr:TetR/AcrR family transcriptional regulator [Anaerotignum propionicum]AMJ40596.1 HTH-type transcriptional repressor KstR2 [Anaerotignum propionicum DSM 1682]SHE92184.1 transcriptional regulator, TetR family [[Clostridium] propionicum DSM 1682] [Anaerotignum propionicum DSM 1682]
MPKFSAIEREKIYSLLLEKGEKLFNEKGFYAVTAEEVALSAGIAKGTFYHFFENKEHLFMVINNSLQASIFIRLQQMLEKPENMTQTERFYQLLCYIMDAFIENPLIINIDAQVWERIEAKAPKACIDENDARDSELVSMMGHSGFSFRYDLERTMKLLQMQFVQLAYIKRETQSIELMKIVLKALAEHLIKEDIK